LVSEYEVNIIVRPGTRKGPYWCRHLRDLEDIVKLRQERREQRLAAA